MKSTSIPALLLATALLLGAGTSSARPSEASYRGVIPLFWSELYPEGGETLYCGTAFGADKGADINIEHVLPMAWAMNKFGCDERDQCRADKPEFNRVESDLHNLYPTRKDINKARGSMTFGKIPGEQRRYGDCDFAIDHRRRRVEPRPAARGEIARAMFYMHETYAIPIFSSLGVLLKEWNRRDPPSAAEMLRNDRIEQIQGARNRFIDNPESAQELRF